jgi:hypothetical protein
MTDIGTMGGRNENLFCYLGVAPGGGGVPSSSVWEPKAHVTRLG